MSNKRKEVFTVYRDMGMFWKGIKYLIFPSSSCYRCYLEYYESGNIETTRIPYNDILAFICEFIGITKVIYKEKWTDSKPYEYWVIMKNKDKVCFQEDALTFIDTILRDIRDDGYYCICWKIQNKMYKGVIG